jgi:hypothetical protein
MSPISVRAVRAVELGVTDLATATRFFTDVWNLAAVATAADTVDIRGPGAVRHKRTHRLAPGARRVPKGQEPAGPPLYFTRAAANP